MRQSQLFTKTRKEAPADETSKNAQLLIRAGFVHKEMAGVYTMLPLGFLTLSKIIKVIKEEMDNIGGQEVLLSSLQEKETWDKTDRWSDDVVDVWFKTKLKNETELGLAFTHEEPLTKLMKEQISSYRDLPKYVYQFQTKFRNETRAKSGVMRTREFIMKDLYSFSRDESEHQEFYRKATQSYENIFKKVGLDSVTYMTFASGGVFSKYSHEFQTLSDSGEDIIYVDESKKLAVNKEVIDDADLLKDMGIEKGSLIEKKAVEVGNIFTLGTRFSESLDLKYKDESGEEKLVFMGSYGIGPARLMGVVAEVFGDDKGLVWPKEVSPFAIHLVRLGTNDSTVSFADSLYENLKNKGIEVLYDDRDLRPGEKFADSDLIGIPVRFVVSDKTVAENKVEVKMRTSTESQLVSVEDAISNL